MKISIITIVYNNANTIAECIESVLSQTYKNIEYIVIDGYSTDGTQAIIEQYKNSIATYISEPDKGLYDALNKGIQYATGDVIGILHSDDIFYNTNCISLIAETFQKTHADLIYGNGIYVSKEKNVVKRVYSAKPFKKRYLQFGWIPLHTTIFVTKDIFNTYGLYSLDYSIASDYDISLRWFTNDTIKKVFINSLLVKMRLGGKSTTAKLQKRKSSEDLHIIRKFKLLSYFTLFCKIARKIPQYILPRILNLKIEL